MNLKQKYGKILVPLVTPFREDQSIDYDAAVSIAHRLVDTNMADSIILSGTTGEFFTQSFDERVKLFQVIKEAVGSKIPLIAGTGAASTKEAVELTKKAAELGFELVMVVAPYYTKPNQEELYNHFATVAKAADVSIMLYNIPIFTGVNVDPVTVGRLAEIPNIVGIKEEAELNPKQMTAFLNATPEDFIVYNGDDTMVLEAYVQGGDRIGGVVSGGSHLVGDRIRTMIEDLLQGDVKKAAATQRQLFKLFRICGQNQRTNPVALLKEGMKLVGYNAGLPRLPLAPGKPEEIAKIREVMADLGLL